MSWSILQSVLPYIPPPFGLTISPLILLEIPPYPLYFISVSSLSFEQLISKTIIKLNNITFFVLNIFIKLHFFIKGCVFFKISANVSQLHEVWD